MLARFFHAWERRLAFATKDRVVRPFEWGTEWINEAGEGSADAAVERWVEEVMEDTSEFFALPPTTDFARCMPADQQPKIDEKKPVARSQEPVGGMK